jgi:O-antigen/teichoic acid export membrane protein
MSILQRIRSGLRDDPTIRRVLRNSGYLFSSNTLSAVLGFVQGIFVTRLLGDNLFGAMTAIIVFVSGVNRLLSFRMNEVVVRYVGEALAQDDTKRASALVKGIGLTEAIFSVLAYLVLLVLSAWGARTFAEDMSLAPLFRFYGLFLLANIVYETSVGILQTTDKFKQVAQANFYQSVVLTILIAVAFFLQWGLKGILTAYLIGKLIAGVWVALSAGLELRNRLGNHWITSPLSYVTNWKEIFSFAFSTNVNGTVNLFARDNLPLYLAAFLPNAQVGYFRLATSLINMVMLPIEPFIWPTYAEITRTIAQKQWGSTRTLLKQVSSIAGIWTLLAGGGLAAFGWWFIPFAYGSEFAPAYICVLILLVGYGVANVLNWNRPLLLALGHPTYPLMVAAITGAIEVLLLIILLPGGSYLTGAAIFSAYLAVSVVWNVLRGLFVLGREEAKA